ncbi:MAG: hypothetical protein AAFR37_15685, partial [Cyanobacteria bacterium J06628_3]
KSWMSAFVQGILFSPRMSNRIAWAKHINMGFVIRVIPYFLLQFFCAKVVYAYKCVEKLK